MLRRFVLCFKKVRPNSVRIEYRNMELGLKMQIKEEPKDYWTKSYYARASFCIQVHIRIYVADCQPFLTIANK